MKNLLLKKSIILLFASIFSLNIFYSCDDQIPDEEKEEGTFVGSEPPSSATNVRVVESTYSSITVDWDIESADFGNLISGNPAKFQKYEVEYSENSDFSDSKVLETPKKPVVIDGLSSDSAYYVRVRIFNDNGVTGKNTSGFSSLDNGSHKTDEILDITPPRNFAAVASDLSIELSWDSPLSNGSNLDGTSEQALSAYVIEYVSQGVAPIEFTTLADAVSYNIDRQISPSTDYTITIKAKNETGDLSEAASIEVTTESANSASPTPVRNLEVLASASTNGNATLSWNAPLSPGMIDSNTTATIVSYTVSYSENQEFPASETTEQTNITTTSTTVSNLKGSTTYYFRIVAINDATSTGLTSLPTSETLVTGDFSTKPSSPTVLSKVSDLNGKLRLDFTPPSDTGLKTDGTAAIITNYIIEYTDPSNQSDEMSFTASQYNSDMIELGSELLGNTEYKIVVYAVNEAGKKSDKSNEISVTTSSRAQGPGVITALTVNTNNGIPQLNFSWTDPTDLGFKADGKTPATTISSYRYVVYSDQTLANEVFEGAPFNNPGSPTKTIEYNTLPGQSLSGLTEYYVVLRAVNEAGGVSENSNTASFTTVDLSKPPGVATALTTEGVFDENKTWTIKWTAPTDFGKDENGDDVTTLTYNVKYTYADITATSGDFSSANVETMLDVSSPLQLQSLLGNKKYFFKIISDNGNISDANRFSTDAEFEVITPGLARGPGTVLLNTEINPDGSIKVSWQEPTDTGLTPEGSPATISSYTIRYSSTQADLTLDLSTSTTPDEKGQTSLQNTQTSYTTPILLGSTTYYFRLIIENSENLTSPSDADQLTGNASTPSDAPTGLALQTGSSATTSSVPLTWNSPSNNGKEADGKQDATITSYTVEYKTNDPNSSYAIFSQSITTSSVIVTGLSELTEYVFRVRATNSANIDSPYSNEFTERTTGTPVPPSEPTQVETFNTIGNGLSHRKTQIRVSWTAPTNTGRDQYGAVGSIEYQVQYRLSPAGNWTDFGSAISVTELVVVSLTPGTTYDFQVRAISTTSDSVQQSPYSQLSTSATLSGAEAPGAPTNVQVAVATSSTETNMDRYHKVNISWTAPTDTGKADNGTAVAIIDHYEVSWKKSSDPVDGSFDPTVEQYTKFNVEPLGNATSQGFTLGNIADFAGRTFVFQIKAVTASSINKTSIASTPSNPYQLLDRIKTIDYDVRKGLGSSSTTITSTGKDVNGNDTTVSQQSFVTKDRINTGTISLVNSPTVTETALQSISKIVSVISSYSGTTAILSLEIEYLSGLKRTYQERKVILSRGTSTYTYDIPATP